METTHNTSTCPLYAMEHLEMMYPEEYNKVYPMVRMCCEMYDVPSNPGFYPYPTRAAVEQMTDYICQNVCTTGETEVNQQFGAFGFGRRFLRPFILILLIRELLRRRRSF